jgi:hypothetical protein
MDSIFLCPDWPLTMWQVGQLGSFTSWDVPKYKVLWWVLSCKILRQKTDKEEETELVEMCICCIKIGIVLVLHSKRFLFKVSFRTFYSSYNDIVYQLSQMLPDEIHVFTWLCRVSQGVTCNWSTSGNAYSSKTPGSTSFTRGFA